MPAFVEYAVVRQQLLAGSGNEATIAIDRGRVIGTAATGIVDELRMADDDMDAVRSRRDLFQASGDRLRQRGAQQQVIGRIAEQ